MFAFAVAWSMLRATAHAAPGTPVSDGQVFEARGVLQRLIGIRASEFEFSIAPSNSALDRYSFEARGGHVRIQASSGVALCRGAYDYLKKYAGCVATWDGDQVALPSILPDAPRTEVDCPSQYRHYFNVCTFGYTTVWWDWKRWRREIDWMALHGINMPLAMNGQEKVWQEVWRSYGLTDLEIRGFFGGPAFLPWQRMGNVNGHPGPLPQSWIDGQSELQKKILKAERGLGMTPVTPAFSGFLPPAFIKHHPETKFRRSSEWCGFEPTLLLDARSPEFREIGKRFIDAYRREFGPGDGLYLADAFNEMRPLVEPAKREEELRAVGEGIYRSIADADPSGVWVSQAWLFHNDPEFWNPKAVEAYLSGVPDDKMILLDLAANEEEIWRKFAAVRRKRYIWNFLHNYGQRTRLAGNLDALIPRPGAAVDDPGHGGFAGMGLTMEGIEQNAIAYELVCDLMWQPSVASGSAQQEFASRWRKAYYRARYGNADSTAQAIGDAIWSTFYKPGVSVWDLAVYQQRPSADAPEEPGPRLEELRKLLDRMMSAESLRASKLFRRDLVDVAKAYFAEVLGVLANRITLSISEGDAGPATRARERWNSLIDQLDALLATVPQHRLDRWIAAARAWGATSAERDFMELNARMQVTVWGGPVLNDYAAKEWSGLVSQFYAPRWARFFDAMQKEPDGPKGFDSAAWELAWCSNKSLRAPKRVDIFSTIEEMERMADAVGTGRIDRGIAVGMPVETNGPVEGDHWAENVVDGYATGAYWAAAGVPRWVKIDLMHPIEIDRVQVFPYAGDGRSYQYTVEISLDGKNWTTVADLSKNTEPSRRRGTLHQFPPSLARYVRVTMLHNTANPSVHLHEVRVFMAPDK